MDQYRPILKQIMFINQNQNSELSSDIDNYILQMETMKRERIVTDLYQNEASKVK